MDYLERRKAMENRKLRSMTKKERILYRRRKKLIKRYIRLLFFLLIIIVLIIAFVKGITGKNKSKLEALTNNSEQNAQTLIDDNFDDKVSKTEVQEAKECRAVITTSGDVVAHDNFYRSKNYGDGESFDFTPIFTYVKDYYESADYAVITPEFSVVESGFSGYPTFKTPGEFIDAMADSGIDMCLLAQNHMLDAGESQVLNNLDAVEKNNMVGIGLRRNVSDKRYHVQDINGIKVGFVDYVFNMGQNNINSVWVTNDTISLINNFSMQYPSPLYTEMEEILSQMKADGAEYIICYMHWGTEYETSENGYQQAIAQKLCNMGVDALIGSHPHVVQPVDLLTSDDGAHQMLCCYSLGNVLSNQRSGTGGLRGFTEDGLMVSLSLYKDKEGQISLEDTEFVPIWVYRNDLESYTNDSIYGENDTEHCIDKYYILPLKDTNDIYNKVASELGNISSYLAASKSRTETTISAGRTKIEEALPVVKK